MATLLLGSIKANAFWHSVLVGVGTMIDQRIFGPKTHTEGSRLDDLQLQASTYGTDIPYCFGTTRVAGNIIWGTNYIEHAHTESVGGKGGGGSTSTTYDYSVSFAVSIGRGPILSIGRVWADGNLMDFHQDKKASAMFSSDGEPDEEGVLYSVSELVTVTATANSSAVSQKWSCIWDSNTKKWNVSGSSSGAVGSFDKYFTYSGTNVSFTVSQKSGSDGHDPGHGATITISVYSVGGKDVNIHLGTEDQLPDEFIEGIEGIGNVPAYRGQAYVVFKNLSLADYGNRIPNITFEVNTQYNKLADIINIIRIDAGLTDSQCTINGMSDIYVPGIAISGSTFREQLEPLQTIYLFDGIEREGKIEFKQRDFSDPIDVAVSDMGSAEGDSSATDNQAYTVSRKNERELPKTLSLTYLSSDNDFQNVTISRSRPNVNSDSDKSVSLSVVMSDAWARSVIETLLYEAWTAQTSYAFTLPNSYANLSPGNILRLGFENRQPYAIVTKVSYGTPGLVKVEATDVGKTTFVQYQRSVDQNITANTIEPATPVLSHFLDIPRLPKDTLSDDEHIYYTANADTYYGARVFKETYHGSTIYANALLYAPAGTFGVAQTALPSAHTHRFDIKNCVDVVLFKGTLASAAKEDILNWANAALIGDEIVQFKDATLIGENKYRLSTLLRGRAGTEDSVGTHTVGERFVLLDSNLKTIPAPRAEWFSPVNYKVGQSTVDVTSEIVENYELSLSGNVALPYSVCHVRGKRNTNGDIALTWRRRTRGDGTWKDYSDVPVNESIEQYSVDVIKNGTVVRTSSTAVPLFSYTAAMQVADFGSIQPLITVRIYQISATRGRGKVKEVAI